MDAIRERRMSIWRFTSSCNLVVFGMMLLSLVEAEAAQRLKWHKKTGCEDDDLVESANMA